MRIVVHVSINIPNQLGRTTGHFTYIYPKSLSHRKKKRKKSQQQIMLTVSESYTHIVAPINRFFQENKTDRRYICTSNCLRLPSYPPLRSCPRPWPKPPPRPPRPWPPLSTPPPAEKPPRALAPGAAIAARRWLGSFLPVD